MFDADAIRAAGDMVGLQLTQAEVEEYREAADTAAARAARLEPSTPEAQPIEDVTEGDDPYNAFLYRVRVDQGSGPLSDLDVAVKDNMAVAGVPMTCGSAAVAFTPSYDATVVSRLRAADAAIMGTTNMDEFALFTTGETCVHGPTENPAVEGGVPGGSSSGSGAAIAAGLVDAALGSDTGGSIRIPASFCGVVGLKPTHRSVPRFGFADLSPTLDHIGPLARDVETACRVFDAIAGPDPNDPSTLVSRPLENTVGAATESVDGLSVAMINEATALADDPVEDAVTAAIERLSHQGVGVESVSLPAFRDATDSVIGISGPEFTALLANGGQVYGTGTGYSDPWRETVVSMDPDRLGDAARETLVVNRALLDDTDGRVYVAAQNARRAWIETVEDALGEVDALVTPTTPMTAPDFGEIQGTEGLLETIALTSPFNLTGHPALSIPCGEVKERPVGLQIVTNWNSEATAAQIGAAVERSS